MIGTMGAKGIEEETKLEDYLSYEKFAGILGRKLNVNTGTQIRVTNVALFGKLLQYVTRFIEKAHFDIDPKYFRVRSIDPHEFCYVDLVLFPSFFKRYEVTDKWSFGVDVSKLSKILPTISSAPSIQIIINDGVFGLITDTPQRIKFEINWLEVDAYNLPEPRKYSFDTKAVLTAKELADIMWKASTVSHEITLSSMKGKLTFVSSMGDYSFTAEVTKPLGLKINHSATASVLLDYLRDLRFLMKECEVAELRFGGGAPLRLDLLHHDKARFSFLFSSERKIPRKKRMYRGGTSLPRISVHKFPEFLLYVTSNADGVPVDVLKKAGIETLGGDYGRMVRILDLATIEKGRIKATPLGRKLSSLFNEDDSEARIFLHNLVTQKIPSYKIMMRVLARGPLHRTEIYEMINSVLKKKRKIKIDSQDLSTLLGLARFCGVLRKKVSLYSAVKVV